jgi:hypothetical protein
MRSTTGAYGEFPDYYYERGNLFGSYLLGHTAGMSHDTRRELEALDGGFPVIRPTPHRQPSALRPPLTSHDRLMDFIRTTIPPDGVRHILRALAAARGVDLSTLSGGDPYARLDDFAIRHLTDEQLRKVRANLERVVRWSRPRRLSRSAAERLSAPPRKAKKQRTPAGTKRRRQDDHPDQRCCALCHTPVTGDDRAYCAAKPHLFMGRVYCASHIPKIEALFT